MKDIMLDLETFGTDSNSVIVSVSAVNFDLESGAVGSSFEIGLDIKEQTSNGGVMDPDTLLWWLDQTKEAQGQLLSLDRLPLIEVFVLFQDWINSLEVDSKNISLWGNGATFDNVILNNLYKRQEVRYPFPYWADRDVRTLVHLSGIRPKDYEFIGTKHKGIDDCLHQIKYCSHALSVLNDL